MDKIYQKTLSGGKNAGFTLIELLVVVLIIGVLAAIALSQYKTAVMKSRFTTMIPIVHALATAQEPYYLENGKYAASFADLVIAPPAGGVLSAPIDDNDSGNIRYPQGFSCRMHRRENIYCTGAQYGYYSYFLPRAKTFGGRSYCVVYLSGSYAQEMRKLCQSFGGKTEPVPAAADYEYWTIPYLN